MNEVIGLRNASCDLETGRWEGDPIYADEIETEIETIAVAGDKPYAGKFWTIDFIPVRPRFAGEKITEFYDSRPLRDTVFAGLRCARAA